MTSCASLLRKCAIFHFTVNNMFSITKVTNISNIHKHFAIFFLIINLKQTDLHAPFPLSSWPPLRMGQMLQDGTMRFAGPQALFSLLQSLNRNTLTIPAKY